MSRRLRFRLILAGLVALAAWVLFFDSHSVIRRAGYARELSRLTTENERLRAENVVLNRQLERGLDSELIERVAREEYGMRRPGERVYRVEAVVE